MAKVFTFNTGNQIPWLAFGTGTALYNKDATQFIKAAIEAGVNHLDGAQMYNNEDTLGEGIRSSGKPRSELFITSKLHGKALQPGQTIKESIQVSLKKLGFEYVDLFLIHDPTPATSQSKETLVGWWKQMEGIYEAGLAKAIGVSNFKVSDLEIILENAKVIPAANQIELHPYVWKAAEPIVKFCHEKGIVVESYGGLTPIVRVQGGPLDATLENIRVRLEKTRGSPVTVGQVLTKWLLAKNIVVVTTTSKVERIKEFQDVEKVPDLTAEEVQQIDQEGAKLHKRVYMGHVFQ